MYIQSTCTGCKACGRVSVPAHLDHPHTLTARPAGGGRAGARAGGGPEAGDSALAGRRRGAADAARVQRLAECARGGQGGGGARARASGAVPCVSLCLVTALDADRCGRSGLPAGGRAFCRAGVSTGSGWLRVGVSGCLDACLGAWVFVFVFGCWMFVCLGVQPSGDAAA